MKKHLLLLLCLLMIPSIIAFPQEIFDGDTVYIDDSRAFISATPHTIQGIQPVEIEFETKQFTGDINFLFGYNGDYLKPFRLERWNPHNDCYTVNSTEYCEVVNWTTVIYSNSGFNHIERNLNGKTDWYYRPNFPVVAGTNYKFRIWIEAPYLPFGKTQEEIYPDYDGKYDVAIYPSSYGSDLLSAYQNDHLYLLDPTVELNSGVEAYWDFDSDTTDATANSHDATSYGTPTQTTGIISNGYSFDGATDYMKAGDFPANTDATSISINAWIKTTDSTADIIDKYSAVNTKTPLSMRIESDKATCVVYDSSNVARATSTTTVTDDVFRMITCVRDDVLDEVRIYVNTNLEDTADSSAVGSTDNSVQWYIGERSHASQAVWYAGIIDEPSIYLVAMSTDGIDFLYNSGSPGVNQQYPFVGSSPPFTIQVNNSFNNTALNLFNATVDGSFYSTTNGTIITPLFQNSTSLHNITIRAEDHFSINELNLNISSNYTGSMFQTEINFSCYEYITNTLLSCTNTTKQYPNAGIYNFTREVTGYYDVTREITLVALDNRTLRFNFSNANINITAHDINNNVSISNFTINITDLNNGFSEITTISGLVYEKNLISGRNYTFFFTKSGYLDKNHTISNYTNQEYEFETYQSNSIDINIYKESDSTLILENITVTFTDLNNTVTVYNTVTGDYLAAGLLVTNYTIDFTSANFSTRTYTLEVTHNSFQTLNAFLIETGGSQTVFTFQDKNTGATIEGVGLVIQKVINGSYQVVESLVSDITGRIGFNYVSEEPYKFITSYTGYLSKNFTLNPILFDTYIINLETSYDEIYNMDYEGIIIDFSPKYYYNDENHTIEFVFAAPSNNFLLYGFNATYKTVTIEANGTTAAGEVLNATIEILNADFQDKIRINYYYQVDEGTIKTFTRDYIIIDGNTEGSFLDSLGEHYGLGIFERIMIITTLVLLVAGGAAYYAGGVAAGTIAAFLFGLFAYTGFIPLWTVIISLISFFIIITWRSSQ